MKLPKVSLLVLLVAVALTSCNATRRAGKDLFVGVTSPALIVYGGATDGFEASQEIADGMDGGGFTQVVTLPFTFVYHGLKHTCWVLVHVVDLFLYPINGVADLHPGGPDIEPLDYYTGTAFDREDDGGMDPQSGERVER